MDEKRYVLSIGLLLLGYCLLGQQLNISIDQIHEIKDLGVDNHIKCISKDNAGNLWVGADNGLYRYNGKQLDRVDIPYVKDMVLTREGKLLVLADWGLYEISSTIFDWDIQHILKSLEALSDTALSFPKTIYQDIRGSIWIGENQSIVRFRDGKIKRFPIALQNVGNYLRHAFNFAEDGYENLWIMSFGGTLYRYDRMAERFIQVELPMRVSETSAFSSAGGGKLWIGANEGVFELSLDQNARVEQTRQVSDLEKIASMSVGKGFAMVASFDKGLFQFNTENNENQKLSTFENLDILDMYPDGNQIWIASSESIFVINSAPFYTFPETLNRFVPTLQQSLDNTFIANLGRQIYQVKSTPEGEEFSLLFEIGDQLWANDALLYKDELWMATSKGVFIYDLQKQELTNIEGTTQNSWLNHIFRSSDGNIWVSNQEDGAVIQVSQNREVRTFPQLNRIRFVAENKGIIYLGGSQGNLFIYIGNNDFQPLNLDWSNTAPDIHDIAFLEDSVYLATSRGIYSFSIGKPSENKIDIHRNLAGHIESVAIARNGDIWFSNAKGLSKINGGEQVTFNRSQGLPSKYIIRRGLTVDTQGQLWVCTSKGLATLLEGALKAYKTPQPFLVSCLGNRRELPIDGYDLGTLFYNSSLGLELITLSFPMNSIQYRTQLINEGVLVDMQNTKGVNAFFDLQTGNYHLDIQAKQSGAEWSNPVRYSFSVRKKWYQTTWFWVAAALTSLVLGYLLIQLYNRSLRQTNEKLELLVRDRTAALEEQKNELIQNQQQIVSQQKELIHKNEVLSETQKALTSSEIKFLELKRDQMRRELDLKTKQLTTHALSILQKNQYLLEISESLDALGTKKEEKDIATSIRKISQHIRNSIKQDDRWEEFRLYFEQVHDDFYAKLKISFPKLTHNDLKQCALVKLNLSLEDSATILGVSSESVRVSRYRIQKKMGLNSQAAFYEYLVKL